MYVTKFCEMPNKQDPIGDCSRRGHHHELLVGVSSGAVFDYDSNSTYKSSCPDVRSDVHLDVLK